MRKCEPKTWHLRSGGVLWRNSSLENIGSVTSRFVAPGRQTTQKKFAVTHNFLLEICATPPQRQALPALRSHASLASHPARRFAYWRNMPATEFPRKNQCSSTDFYCSVTDNSFAVAKEFPRPRLAVLPSGKTSLRPSSLMKKSAQALFFTDSTPSCRC